MGKFGWKKGKFKRTDKVKYTIETKDKFRAMIKGKFLALERVELIQKDKAKFLLIDKFRKFIFAGKKVRGSLKIMSNRV